MFCSSQIAEHFLESNKFYPHKSENIVPMRNAVICFIFIKICTLRTLIKKKKKTPLWIFDICIKATCGKHCIKYSSVFEKLNVFYPQKTKLNLNKLEYFKSLKK